jgi:glucose/arabinose dehydrogenase
MSRRALRSMFVLALSSIGLSLGCGQESDSLQPTIQAITLPNQFADSLVAKVGSPTALAFTPDGRILITSQKGSVRVVKNDQLLAASAINLSSTICTNSERGVLGVAVDPDFSSNQFVYLYYTFKKNGNCDTNNPDSGPVNRVSRFKYDLNNDTLGSETVLLDNILSLGGNHNGGDIHFGADKNLYISVGDSGCQLNGGGCGGGNQNGKHKNILNGKILRIKRDGTIPSDNPWVNAAGARRCGQPGTDPQYRLASDAPCVETYAWGLRNPFRFAFNADGTVFNIDDVGQNVSEEIDRGAKGANYGWPTREGYCANGQSCGGPGNPPAGMTDPIFSWDRDGGGVTNGCKSITGGAFVPPGAWGSAYEGSYLFGDYVCGKIFKLSSNGSVSVFGNALGGSSAVALVFGPDQNLYYTSYAGGGEIHKVRFTGNANRPPIARVSADPVDGAVPLLVHFDGSTSSDPDSSDSVVSYTWDFGDGTSPRTTNTATVVHTYNSTGNFTAKLVVTDSRGLASAADTVTISAGNTAPTVSISSPNPGRKFAVGESITLSASASDAQDGTLTGNSIQWTVLRRHNDHTHPYATGSGNILTIQGPEPEDLQAATNSSLEVTVTARDSAGLAADDSLTLEPKKVNLQFKTSPNGLNLVIDNTTTVTAPATVVSWEGWKVNISAPAQAGYSFQSWSDGGAASHQITTPGNATVFTATFAPGAAPFSAKVNFQPAGPGFADYAVDTGAAFGPRDGGLKFGWNGDNSATTRDRDSAASPDQRYDTLIHLQKPELPNAVWEIEVPNGSYDVHVVAGDAGFVNSVYRINAEGVPVLSGTPTAANHWVEGNGTVTVNDGRLSISSGAGAVNNKIDFIEIKRH